MRGASRLGVLRERAEERKTRERERARERERERERVREGGSERKRHKRWKSQK